MAQQPEPNKIIYSMVGVSKFHGKKQVLKDIYLSYFYGAKIGVLGLNGSGKSTLLRILAGKDTDHLGETVISPGYTVGLLEQEPQLDQSKTVIEIVQEGVQPILDLLKEFDDINNAFGDPDADMDKLMDRQAKVQDKLDATGAWDLDSKLEMAMDALRCPPGETPVATLSGGEKRRVALCRLLLQAPDILLLDEPTNHLDLTMIEWLEHELERRRAALVMISHDRRFLSNLSRGTAWLDRGQTRRVERGFSEFEAWRDEVLAEEERDQHKLDRKIVAEEHWLRYGVSARRKR
ncbi:MAG TPA: ATP-binding cassette domain-containing protein, partial [Thermoanaerobaculia bacterium]|nr:ATP-binding cassette domain-containing protein [Thermoanaerobaculia bacterium]